MTINDGYYIAECTSSKHPIPRKELDTFFIPTDIVENVTKDENQNDVTMYSYKEYRFNVPINYEFPIELIEIISNMLTDCYKSNSELEEDSND